MHSAAELAAGAAAAAAFDALRAPWSEASGALRVTLAEQLRAFHALAPAGPVPTAFSPHDARVREHVAAAAASLEAQERELAAEVRAHLGAHELWGAA